MFALGCIQALKCNSNHCPTGIRDAPARARVGLDVPSKARRVANFQRATVHAAQEIIGAAGCTAPDQISADMIFRRESGVHVRSYADLHERYFPMLRARRGRRLLERARGARRALSGTDEELRPAFPSTPHYSPRPRQVRLPRERGARAQPVRAGARARAPLVGAGRRALPRDARRDRGGRLRLRSRDGDGGVRRRRRGRLARASSYASGFVTPTTPRR